MMQKKNCFMHITDHRSTFDVFKSNVCHLLKEMGDIHLAIEILCSGVINDLYERQWFPESMYMLAMLDYICRKNDIELCNDYDWLRIGKLERIVYPSSVLLLYYMYNDENILKKCFDNSIPEFKRFNIAEGDVENVV